MNTLAGLEATLGKEWMEKILSSKILLVGAGGIGCELLKNLALSGFRDLEVIDLDTIDVSNLNRQFLFRSQHVGKPKCEVACQVAMDMIPSAEHAPTYQAHHGNVCDNEKFNVQYVSKFDLVLNALDNVTARRRVNRLCLAADKPLVEAGTTGYLGQVKVIHKSSNIACYECQTQETQKVYPICTIRSTPSMPVHTIVWAKELYKLLFGDKPEESMLYEDPNGEEPSTYMEAVTAYRDMLKGSPESRRNGALHGAAHQILVKLYADEIEKQLGMGRYKTAKKTPTALEDKTLAAAKATKGAIPSQEHKTTDTWSCQECVTEFAACLAEAPYQDQILPSFDKDDDLAMRLVTAASNLRSHVFGIQPLQSLYSAKGIAGNIIPAIATTNAIIAGLQVLQVFHILKAQLENKPDTLMDRCRYVDCLRNKTGRPEFYISSSRLDAPNPKCFVCRNATIPLTLNVNKWTLQSLLDRILKKDLGFENPTLMLGDDMIYEEGDGADASFQANLPKLLPSLPCGGIQHGTMFRVEDFTQDLEVDVCVTHQDVWEKKDDDDDDDGDEDKYVIGGEKPVVSKPAAVSGVAMKPAPQSETANDQDDEIEVIDDDDDDGDKKMAAIGSTKRKSNGNDDKRVAKRLKPNPKDIIVLD